MTNRLNGEKIKRWREERNWSQEDLAEAAGVGLRTVQRIEKGEPASRDTIAALAAAFDTDRSMFVINSADRRKRDDEAARSDAVRGLRLSLKIHAWSFVLGMVVFAAISVSDGPGGYAMTVPALWWTVGLVAHRLVLALVEMIFDHQRAMPSD